MLSREDSRRLAELERQLRREDPEFCARMSGGAATRPAPRRAATVSLILTAIVIWTAAIILAVLGWWIAAVIAALSATVVASTLTYRLVRHRADAD
jgi:Flp pilus assembly protein TadB